jgi:hypothetical protein
MWEWTDPYWAQRKILKRCFQMRVTAICRKRVTAMVFDLNFKQVNAMRVTA